MKKVNLASQTTAKVNGQGAVQLSVAPRTGQHLNIELKNTLFVPDLRLNLVSVAKITDKDYTVAFTKSNAVVTDKFGNQSTFAERRGDLFFIRERVECANVET